MSCGCRKNKATKVKGCTGPNCAQKTTTTQIKTSKATATTVKKKTN